MVKHVYLAAGLFLGLQVYSQNDFDKYGPFGSEVYKDLAGPLKIKQKVYKIDLSYQPIDLKLYDQLHTITDLQVLKLCGNKLERFPANFDKLINLVYFASCNNAFVAFPENLKPFLNLQSIDLQDTKIDSIPARIAYLDKLRSFKFGNTNDTLKLPYTLRYLRNLKDVSIENCKIDSVPYPLFEIPSLKFLSLVNTRTFALPNTFDKLKNLEVLVIENNGLTSLPFSIYKAQKIRTISLRFNNLSHLPESISQLPELSLLDLRGNSFSLEEREKLKSLLPDCEIKF